MWSTVYNFWKRVTHSRKGTHLNHDVNMTLCQEDEFEITQSQNLNVTFGSSGIVLYSEEGKKLIGFTSSDSVIVVFIILLT